MNDQNAPAYNAPAPTVSGTPPANQPGKNATAPKKKTAAELKAERDQRISTQNHLQFREIRDNIVMMRDGSLRMVIRASAINFDLMSPEEQDTIEYAYQGFLNSLHFPIQIVIRSRRIDLGPYLDKLENLQASQENQLLAGLMEDYIYNIRGLLEEVNIMNKEFYVIIHFHIGTVSKDNIASKLSKLFKPNDDVVQSKPEFEKAKRDLLNRTNTVAQGLAQMGIRVAVLGTQELIELFYSSYNLEESQVQTLTEVDQLITPYVTRSEPANRGQVAPLEMPAGIAHDELADDMYAAAAKRAAGQPAQSNTIPGIHQPAPEPTQNPKAETPPDPPQSEQIPIPPNPLLQNQTVYPAAQTPPNPLEAGAGQNKQPPAGGGY